MGLQELLNKQIQVSFIRRRTYNSPEMKLKVTKNLLIATRTRMTKSSLTFCMFSSKKWQKVKNAAVTRLIYRQTDSLPLLLLVQCSAVCAFEINVMVIFQWWSFPQAANYDKNKTLEECTSVCIFAFITWAVHLFQRPKGLSIVRIPHSITTWSWRICKLNSWF